MDYSAPYLLQDVGGGEAGGREGVGVRDVQEGPLHLLAHAHGRPHALRRLQVPVRARGGRRAVPRFQDRGRRLLGELNLLLC